LQKEGSSSARTDDGVDFAQQIRRDYNVRSLCAIHMYICIVP
jgi:hypothetical protein